MGPSPSRGLFSMKIRFSPLPLPLARARAPDQGIVLLNALVIISVVAAIAATLIRSGLESTNRYELMLRSDQARVYARAAEALAAELLALDAKASEIDHLGERWAQDQGTMDIEGAVLTGKLYDLQGRLNINTIVETVTVTEGSGQGSNVRLSTPEYDLLRALIKNAGGAERLAPRMAEWISPGVEGLPGAAGDTPYLRMDQPYLRPASGLISAHDIRLVEGLKPFVFDALDRNITALPGETSLNVNTAPQEVIEAMMPGLSATQIERFLRDRQTSPFASRAEFETYIARILSPTALEALRQLDIDVKTNWFLLETTVEHGLSRARLYSIILRPDEGGRARIHLRSGSAI